MATVVYKVGNDISTDVIYPGRFMATVLPAETPQFAFADDATFNGKIKARQIPPGSVVVAGSNFGCGSCGCQCRAGERFDNAAIASGVDAS